MSSSEVPTIAFILEMADVKVTVVNLQPHADAMQPNGNPELLRATARHGRFSPHETAAALLSMFATVVQP